MQTPYHLLKNVATHYPGTHTPDDSYVPKSSHSAAATTIPCRLQPISTEESLRYDANYASTLFNCWLAPINSAGAAVAIAATDKLSVDGTLYLVEGNQTTPAGDGALFKVLLRKETPG